MKQVLSNFVFSVFKHNNIEDIKSLVKEFFDEKIVTNKATIKEDVFDIDDYIDSFSGNTNYELFSFWKTSNYPDLVFFTSNFGDGRFTLCNAIHKRLKCEYIQCTLRDGNNNIYPAYFLHFANENMEERDILAYKDPKWVFYEKGTPLPFEETELYNQRRIKQRLNCDIIINYLHKYGVEFENIDLNITENFTYSSYN